MLPRLVTTANAVGLAAIEAANVSGNCQPEVWASGAQTMMAGWPLLVPLGTVKTASRGDWAIAAVRTSSASTWRRASVLRNAAVCARHSPSTL